MQNDQARTISGRRFRAWTACNWSGGISILAVTLVCLAGPASALTQDQTLSGATAVTTRLPEDTLSLEQRADIYMVRKYYPEAVQAYSRLTQAEPYNAVFHNKLGIAYHQMQDLNAARRSYRRAIELNPDYAQAINNLASVEYARNRYRDAILTYLRALELNPGDAVIYGNLGTAYFAREEFEYATQSFRYALMLDPEVFRRSGRVGTIVQARDDSDPAAFNFYMAKTYASIGNADDTFQFLLKAWEEGYPDLYDTILEEEVFQFLTVDPRFEQLLALISSTGESSATTPIRQ